jgi:hypothetical protein
MTYARLAQKGFTMATITQLLRLNGTSFNEDVTELMGDAFDAACEGLGNVSDSIRAAIADRIIEEAGNGERDPIRLRDAGTAGLKPSG